MNPTIRNTVVLQAIIDRSTLDTFDLWTRFEALPRLRRRDLLGDTAAVGRSSGTPPRVAPSAITAVEGADGYRAAMWIRPLDGSSSVVSLVTEDPDRSEHAARDLARFVEFALVDSMEVALASWDVWDGTDIIPSSAWPARLSTKTAGYRSLMNDERFPPAAADRMPTVEEERAADRAAEDVDLEQVASHYEEMAEIGADVRGEGQIEPDA